MKRERWLFAFATVVTLIGLLGSRNLRTNAESGLLPGTGGLSGQVSSPKPFKAAQVYARNLDKGVLYMVYTAGGRYQAPNLMPGNYEVWGKKGDLQSDSQKLQVKAGDRASIDLTLREVKSAGAAPAVIGSFGRNTPDGPVELVTYDKLYPPDPRRDLAERTCIYCHGVNFLARFHQDRAAWTKALEKMENPKMVRGAEIPPGTLTAKQREDILDYLTEHFGPDSPKRGLTIGVEFPADEQALGRAMYVEYELPLDEKHPKRRAQDPHFDNDGNVWYTEIGEPHGIVKLDPRTVKWTSYEIPDPTAHPHGLTVDSHGDVFWSEVYGFHLGRLNPKSGKIVRYPMDPEGKIPGGEGHTPVLDSKENIWFTVVVGDQIGKWDRQTEKIKLWPVPSTNGAQSFPYGILMDKKDKVWFAMAHRAAVTRFDPVTEKFTEYRTPTQPGNGKRLGMDSKGRVWYGIITPGRVGKLVRLDSDTGKMVEYKMPLPYSEPYDVWADPQDQVWISDPGQGGTLIRFDPQTEKFTYYPTPRRTDQPKLDITRDGAIWYCTRSADKGAVGVLYPDVAKMSYGAYR